MPLTEKELKILIIEDDEIELRSLECVLSDMGAAVLTANDGVAGLRKVCEDKPDLVILDLKLPVLSGIDVLRELKKLNSDVPVIVLTAYKDKRNDVFEVGYNNMVVFLYKPIEGEHLEMLFSFFSWRKRGRVA